MHRSWEIGIPRGKEEHGCRPKDTHNGGVAATDEGGLRDLASGMLPARRPALTPTIRSACLFYTLLLIVLLSIPHDTL